MKRQKRSIVILITLIAFLVLPAIIQAGQLTPSATPAPTMKSLDELYQKLSAMENRMKAMQQSMGIKARFLDNGNGTITDISTGLIWLKNANPCGTKNWDDAMAYCASLASGTAGLTDGSAAGQWRLPTIAELEGLGTDPPITWHVNSPPVPWTIPGTPFTNVQVGNYDNGYDKAYWASTEVEGVPVRAYFIWLQYGVVGGNPKGIPNYVWPVRNPQ
jgi:hypothetical protein